MCKELQIIHENHKNVQKLKGPQKVFHNKKNLTKYESGIAIG